MKRLFLFLFVFGTTLTVMAGNGKMFLISGEQNIFENSAYAILKIDYSDALWEGENYKSFCGDDYQERIEKSYTSFFSSFNSKSKGIKLVERENAQYIFTIKVHSFLRKLRAFYRGEVMVWCTIVLTDSKTGEECVKIEIERCGGANDYACSDGIYKCFSSLAERILEGKYNTLRK